MIALHMQASSPDPDLVRRCEELARPLYVGLDGAAGFHRVDRVRARLRALTERKPADDAGLLEILAVFHGVVGRLGSMAPGGRFDLFLAGLGLEEVRRRRIRGGLRRFEDDPRAHDERLLHDAVLLEQAGIGAVVDRLLAAGRKRMDAERAVAALDSGPPPERFATAAGADWARREQAATGEWLEELRRRLADARQALS